MINRILIKISKFGVLYAFAVTIYYVFDFIYMPWLAIKFGYKLFFPLYPSVIIANLAGVYVYDYFKEDVLFIELGKNWLCNESNKFVTFRQLLIKRKWLTFIALSIWPSPIASYLFFRKTTNESPWMIFKVIAIGSVFCTAFWGIGLSVIISLVNSFMRFFKVE